MGSPVLLHALKDQCTPAESPNRDFERYMPLIQSFGTTEAFFQFPGKALATLSALQQRTAFDPERFSLKRNREGKLSHLTQARHVAVLNVCQTEILFEKLFRLGGNFLADPGIQGLALLFKLRVCVHAHGDSGCFGIVPGRGSERALARALQRESRTQGHQG
jgi:hypothetical protein